MRLLFLSNMGPAEVVTVSCDVNTEMALQKVRVARSNDPVDCLPAPKAALTPNQKLPQNYLRGGGQVMPTLLLRDTLYWLY